jgi:hypothetical protein
VFRIGYTGGKLEPLRLIENTIRRFNCQVHTEVLIAVGAFYDRAGDETRGSSLAEPG